MKEKEIEEIVKNNKKEIEAILPSCNIEDLNLLIVAENKKDKPRKTLVGTIEMLKLSLENQKKRKDKDDNKAQKPVSDKTKINEEISKEELEKSEIFSLVSSLCFLGHNLLSGFDKEDVFIIEGFLCREDFDSLKFSDKKEAIKKSLTRIQSLISNSSSFVFRKKTDQELVKKHIENIKEFLIQRLIKLEDKKVLQEAQEEKTSNQKERNLKEKGAKFGEFGKFGEFEESN